ncbi:MAG: class I SAM-dependent methyltransferase [Umezawaea sp.]
MIPWTLTVLVVLFVVLDALRLRGRVASLRVLARGGASSDHVEFTAVGVDLPADVGHADDLALVDLIPPDLPVVAALDLLGAVDPKTYQADRWTRGISASQAMRCRADAVDGAPDVSDPTEFVAFARRVKDHEGAAVDLAVAPGLVAGPYDLTTRTARLRQLGKRPALWVAGSVIGYLAVVSAVLLTPWGLVAAAVYCAHPALVFAGTPLRPKDLLVAVLLRPVRTPYLWVRTLGSRWRSTQEREHDEYVRSAAPNYQAEIALGVERFLEPRRDTCPSCGSASHVGWVRSTDLVQRKPGEFTMDRCADCGHVWQNPRLTEAGLDFYYRDFYDGSGASAAEAVFSGKSEPYHDRARMVVPFATPERWLDVGSGHAHFCRGAKEILPETSFDGLDQGAAIEDAARLGWIDTAYRGSFKDFAGELRDRYDVISMHHYLEHTRDPWDELDLAADLLPDGGYLLIELPDPEWRLGRLFGRYWMPWFQPQHQHMMPIANLKVALVERGLTPVAEERGKAHSSSDFMVSGFLFLASIAPRSPSPWRPRKVRFAALRGAVVWTAGIPLLIIAGLLDRTVNRTLSRRSDRGNAYRVLARKEQP